VIENLAPICGRSKELAAKVRYSTKQLFRVVGTGEPGFVAVFEPYQQIMLAARSLIALVSVTGEDAAKLIVPGLLVEIVDRDRQARGRSQTAGEEEAAACHYRVDGC
jgi:hypothetical protein